MCVGRHRSCKCACDFCARSFACLFYRIPPHLPECILYVRACLHLLAHAITVTLFVRKKMVKFTFYFFILHVLFSLSRRLAENGRVICWVLLQRQMREGEQKVQSVLVFFRCRWMEMNKRIFHKRIVSWCFLVRSTKKKNEMENRCEWRTIELMMMFFFLYILFHAFVLATL